MIPTGLLIRLAVIAAAVAAVLWGYHLWAESLREDGREEIRAEHAEAARAAETRMRELARAAEVRYVVQAEARDRFITKTLTEVRHAAAPLVSCVLPADAVRLLNDANACASDPTAAACGGPGPVRDAEPLAGHGNSQ